MPGLDVSTGVPQQTHQRAQPRRLRAWTAAALGDVAYTAAVLVWSIAGFTILVTGVAVTASLLVLVVGIPVWIGFAYLLRWTTAVDRRLAGWQRHETVTANYRRPETRGFVAFLRTDPGSPDMEGPGMGRDELGDWLRLTARRGHRCRTGPHLRHDPLAAMVGPVSVSGSSVGSSPPRVPPTVTVVLPSTLAARCSSRGRLPRAWRPTTNVYIRARCAELSAEGHFEERFGAGQHVDGAAGRGRGRTTLVVPLPA